MILSRSMQCAVSTMCFWWMSNKRKQRGKKRCSEDILSSYSVNQIHMLTGSSEIRHSSQHLLTHRGLQWSLKTLTDEAFVWNLTPSKGITLFWCGSYKKTGYWLIRVYLRTNEQSNAEKVFEYWADVYKNPEQLSRTKEGSRDIRTNRQRFLCLHKGMSTSGWRSYITCCFLC